jgi:hypothetical protein
MLSLKARASRSGSSSSEPEEPLMASCQAGHARSDCGIPEPINTARMITQIQKHFMTESPLACSF